MVRSSYAAEALAATHGYEDAFPSIIALHELHHGVLTPLQFKDMKEQGGIGINVTLTIDAESVYKSLISKDLHIPTEDMAADGHTKGSIDQDLLLKIMQGV